MIEVSADHFTLLKKELKDAPTFAYSVLDLMIEGTVYADSDKYHSLLIQTASGLYFVTGHSSNKLFLKGIVSIFEKSVILGKRFTIFSNEETWNQSIEKYLEGKVRRIERYSFSFDLLTYKNRKRNNLQDYNILKKDNDLIEHSLEFDKKYFDEYWDTAENFLQNGIGFCVLEREKIISEGVSIFKSENYAEIDIITDLNYRGKGLASMVAEQFIDYCISQNIQPRWDCDVDNGASINLGSQLGFIDPQKYAVYIIKE
ncbi:GNAT family N-acetyltransferase [Cytobacillus massiliigabonensis]|uniref:GNAT family N-acetyltransferase n=1 Tax=Cytobacillus massiliigabonensis TaxID=1871011 RepID=UPI000C8632D0|nr:GNAT family N-acetyltransferase [Cytobacillus massiliigabonensis]